MRLIALQFLLQSSQSLGVSPIVKYSALALFADRFYPSITRSLEGNKASNWLLRPIRECSLQLFSLVSIWISSKMHESRPLSIKNLKSFADKTIKEQHFTARDILEAEVILMQVLDFNIGTSNVAFRYLEELLIQFKGVARVGELVKLEACMEIMDLLYEKEETSVLYHSPCSFAASILVCSYVITVPRHRWEFPVLPWVKFVTSCAEEEILGVVRAILEHLFNPISTGAVGAHRWIF